MSLRGSIPRAPTHMAGLGRVRRAARALGPVRRRPRARGRTRGITAGDADQSPEIRTDHDGALETGRADDYEDDDDDHHRARGVDHGSDVDDRSDLHDNRRVDHNHGGLRLPMLRAIHAQGHTPIEVAGNFHTVTSLGAQGKDPLVHTLPYQWNFLPAMPYLWSVLVHLHLPWETTDKIPVILAEGLNTALVVALATSRQQLRAF